MKSVYIIHGWGGRSDKGWLLWLNKKLSSEGFKVFSPIMPDPENPKIDIWVNYLKKIVERPDKDTYFIGHSIGCQTIVRYLESLPEETKIGGVFFVAGWFNLKSLETEEEKLVSEPWLKKPIDFKKVKNKIRKAVALFSDNDPYVPLSDSKIFKEKLNAEIIIEKNKGHYIESEIKEIPALLNKILEIIK